MIARAALLTVRDLIGGLLLAVVTGGLIDALGRPYMLVFRILSILAAGCILYLGIRLWGRDISRMAGAADPESAGRRTARVLMPVIVTIGVALGLLEPSLVQRGATAGLGIHIVYTLLFVPATLVIASVGAFVIGKVLRGPRFGARLALGGGLAAAAAFLVVDLAMDAIGWRVGAPGAAQRATMVVVTTLGICAAAIAAGTVIGSMLTTPFTSRTS